MAAVEATQLPLTGEAGAEFNMGRSHRLKLWRTWGPAPKVLFVMLNPSIANETQLDPTLRKCMGFAKRWGYGGMWIGNLYTRISTYPEDLVGEPELNDPRADQALLEMARESKWIVAAWGTQPFLTHRAHHVGRLLNQKGYPLWCLGQTKDGWPRHPLYRGYEAELELWVGR